LHDTDVVAILEENVVNTLPARTVGPSAVNQNYISNVMVFVVVVLRGERTAAQ
jgi:hypothetical protein